MKVSLNWLKQYVTVNESKEEVSDILTNIGLEVEGMDIFENIKGSLAGLVLGEVLTCQKHPGADKLSITTVNIGAEAPLQIVCGAPNAPQAVGKKVVVATVGTILYTEDGGSFKIKKGKIRGEESIGMICAEDEIGLGNSHDGIIVLEDEKAIPGMPAAEYFSDRVVSDVVYEIGLTPNRSDATGHLGTAFDLAAALRANYSTKSSRFFPLNSDYNQVVSSQCKEVLKEAFKEIDLIFSYQFEKSKTSLKKCKTLSRAPIEDFLIDCFKRLEKDSYNFTPEISTALANLKNALNKIFLLKKKIPSLISKAIKIVPKSNPSLLFILKELKKYLKPNSEYLNSRKENSKPVYFNHAFNILKKLDNTSTPPIGNFSDFYAFHLINIKTPKILFSKCEGKELRFQKSLRELYVSLSQKHEELLKLDFLSPNKVKKYLKEFESDAQAKNIHFKANIFTKTLPLKGIQYEYRGEGAFTQPDVADFAIDNNNLKIEVSVENQEACPRYAGICIEGVTIQDSPTWMQNHLKAIGVEPKNNVVDITNYVLHELGQPLHAFDYDAIKGNKVIVKNLAEKTKFTTLDEVERELSAEDLMICDGNGDGMCIAGVFGGATSGVKDNTTNIFLESAFFNAISIRRSSMRHLLRTDAATRFEKGVDPNGALYALKRAALLIKEYAGGNIASEVVDFYPTPVERAQVSVSFEKVTDLIGADIPKEDIKKILGYLDMNILEETAEAFTIDVPTNKVDVTRDADVIEEILRIYGYNKVETPTTVSSVLSFAPKPNPFKVRNLIADLLTSSGFNEMMATSMTRSDYYKKHLPQDENSLVYVNNTSNQHLDLMRPSMLFSGLETIVHNQNRQNQDLKLYEFGKTYFKKVIDGEGNRDYFEKQHISLFLTGQRHSENWHQKENKVNFYTLKAYVEHVMTRLGILPGSVQCTPIKEDDAVLTYGLKYHRGKQNIVSFGRLDGNIALGMGIKQEVFYADFDFDTILQVLKKHKMKYQAMSKYPAVRRDLALVLDKSVGYNEVLGIAVKTGGKQLQTTNLFDVYENEEQIGANKKSCSVSFIFQDDNKTLKDKDIDKVMSKLIATYEKKLNALIRK